MGKKRDINQITTILSTALRHKIGAILGIDKRYFKKYEIEFSARRDIAKKILKDCNFNSYDKNIIRILLKRKLERELEKRDYINEKKFVIMNEEIDNILKELGLN